MDNHKQIYTESRWSYIRGLLGFGVLGFTIYGFIYSVFPIQSFMLLAIVFVLSLGHLYSVFKFVLFVERKVITTNEGVMVKYPSKHYSIRWGEVLEFGRYSSFARRGRIWNFYLISDNYKNKKIGLGRIFLPKRGVFFSRRDENKSRKFDNMVVSFFLKSVNANFITLVNVAVIPFTTKNRPIHWKISEKLIKKFYPSYIAIETSNKIEPNYNCPVCLGLPMSKLKFPEYHKLDLDRCKKCGGIWFDYNEVSILRTMKPVSLKSKIVLQNQICEMKCHSCQYLMNRNNSSCPSCGWKNIIDCPKCNENLKNIEVQGLTLDVCRSCKGVWFDQMELSEIWNEKLTMFFKKHGSKKRSDLDKVTALEFLADAFIYDPYVLSGGVRAFADTGESILANSSEIISETPEIAEAMLEGTGELAGSVFENVANIIGEIFD